MTVVEILNWISVAAYGVATGLWLTSTLKKVPPDPRSTDFQIIEDGHGAPYDVLETARLQTVLNTWAALVTAVAVGSQAVALFLGQISY